MLSAQCRAHTGARKGFLVSGDARTDGDLELHRRIDSIVRAAGEHGTGISLDDLVDLLPESGPTASSDLASWIRQHPELARLDSDRAYAPAIEPSGDAQRRARAVEYRLAAERTANGPLAPIRRWIRVLGVTGSTAYGEPEAGDDLDLLLVTQTGALWVTLAWAFLAFRIRGRPMAGGQPVVPCVNYALDDTQAVKEFVRPGGFLFAREALTTRVLLGEPLYRAMLGTAPWMAREIPRLYSRRRLPPPPGGVPLVAAPMRALNAVLFLILATYLQGVGLVRNARLRRQGRPDDVFRTATTLHRFAFASVRFERLKAQYGAATPSVGGSAPIAHDPSSAARDPRSKGPPTQSPPTPAG